jgi:protein-L-isoaspartate(D-aspartate) O-methyltransferase
MENLINYWKSTGIVKDKNLLEAFRLVPRGQFIRKEYLPEVYTDHPLPIGSGQTISQPTTVMIMIQALDLRKTDKVLEIGAGSGWCAAIMSKLAKKVITTEIIPELAEFAKNNIRKAAIKNVEVINCDGSHGYKKEAPYDKIMVTAACPEIPKPLIIQLKDSGILIAPVGSIYYGQNMIKLTKKTTGPEEENLGSFVFVPLKGKYGF